MGRVIGAVAILLLAGAAGCFGNPGNTATTEDHGLGQTWKSINETFMLDVEPPGVASKMLTFREDARLVRLHVDHGSQVSDQYVLLRTPAGDEYAFSSNLSRPVVVLGVVMAGLGHEGWLLEVGADDGVVVPYDILLTIESVVEVPPSMARLEESTPWGDRGERVVVAVIDSGINVYHEAFAADANLVPDAIDATTGLAPINATVTLDAADWSEAVAIDYTLWDNAERGQIYRFLGTRVLGVSVGDPQYAAVPVLDIGTSGAQGHGTKVAGSILASHPGATIVAVQAPSPDWVSTILALEWVEAQPWIDIVVMSMSNVASVPTGSGVDDMAVATRAVVSTGKMLFVSSGNQPGVSWTSDPVNGPPWVLQIGAATNRSGDQALLSSTAPDFVSDYDFPLARHDSLSDYTIQGGTSYATPKAAGAFARALHQVRAEVGHVGGLDGQVLARGPGMALDRHDLEDAIARAAAYWSTEDYNASAVAEDVESGRIGFRGAPILPGTPWLQMGWGYLDGDAGDRAAAHLLGMQPLPEKPPEAVAYMEARLQAREAVWGPGP